MGLSFPSSGYRNVDAQRPESDAVREGDCEGGRGRLHQDPDRCWLHSSLDPEDPLVPVEEQPTPSPLLQVQSLSVRELPSVQHTAVTKSSNMDSYSRVVKFTENIAFTFCMGVIC